MRQQRELTKALKEQAKLSEQEQARLQVAAYENAIEVLLSVHRDASPQFDWIALLTALTPHWPSSPEEQETRERLRALARGVLAGEEDAYRTALTELSKFGELAALGSSLGFRFHGPKLAECEVTVNGHECIPSEMKSLTAAGKLASKSMPKARFHEIYQDYVCGCVLRTARELFALLPLEDVIVTARGLAVDSATGREGERPVLSVAISRDQLSTLDFAQLDPSDSMENFLRRGDVVASRKSGEFVAIDPLKPEEIASTRPPKNLNLSSLIERARTLRGELSLQIRRPIPIAPSSSPEI